MQVGIPQGESQLSAKQGQGERNQRAAVLSPRRCLSASVKIANPIGLDHHRVVHQITPTGIGAAHATAWTLIVKELNPHLAGLSLQRGDLNAG